MEIISGEIREAGKRGPSSMSVLESIGVIVEAIVCLGGRVVVAVVMAGVDIVFCGCVVWLKWRGERRGGEKKGRRNCGMLMDDLVWFDEIGRGES